MAQVHETDLSKYMPPPSQPTSPDFRSRFSALPQLRVIRGALDGLPNPKTETAPNGHVNGHIKEAVDIMPQVDRDDVAEFMSLHPGFVPHLYPPTELGAILTELDQHRQKPPENVVFLTDTKGIRPEYHGNGSEPVENLRLALNHGGIYNSHDGENINLHTDEARPVRDRAKEVLESGRVKVILPFASEAGSIGGVMRYAMGRVGKENVIAIDAETDPEAGLEAVETKGKVLKQKEVLGCVDWGKLKELGILPPQFSEPAKGAKGLTMYAGMLALEAQGALTPDTILAFHDTDIVNPGPQDPQAPGTEGEYSALDYLAIPYAFPPQGSSQIHGVYSLRTGAGRNNEPWTHTFNVLARSGSRMQDPIWYKYATLITTLGWPLTGERTLSGTVERNGEKVPLARALGWTTKMGIETYLNLALTGIDTRSEERQIMQVANPDPKLENRESPRDREFSIVDSVALFGYDMFEHSQATGRLPHEWTISDIAKFNQTYAQEAIQVSVPSRTDHHGNKIVDVNPDFILPSMQDLRDLDVVDWERLQQLVRKAA